MTLRNSTKRNTGSACYHGAVQHSVVCHIVGGRFDTTSRSERSTAHQGESLQASLRARSQANHRPCWQFERGRWAQLLSALSFLRTRSIVHCDVKPSNILISRTYTMQVADFGSSGKVGERRRGCELFTVPYRPHECLMCTTNCTIALACSMDVWSVGCVLYELMRFSDDAAVTATSNIVMVDGTYAKGWDLPALRKHVESRCVRKCSDGDTVARFVLQCMTFHEHRRSADALLSQLSAGQED